MLHFHREQCHQIVGVKYIAQGTGIPEPKVAMTVAALVREGLVRQSDRFRLAFYDSRYGQVFDEGATMTANKRSCVGNAKNHAMNPKGPAGGGNVPIGTPGPEMFRRSLGISTTM